MGKKSECDTLSFLYLLQLALDLNRQGTIKRNKYFKGIGRTDRYIDHLDAPQMITNFLDWHNEDKENNLFDGNVFYNGNGKLDVINNYISAIGGVRKGPATRVYTQLKKNVKMEYYEWADEIHQPPLYLENWGYEKLYKAEKEVENCTMEELQIVLSFVNPAPTPEAQEEKGNIWNDFPYRDFPQGAFEMFERQLNARKKKHPLLQVDGWREKTLAWFRENNVDGAKYKKYKMNDLCGILVKSEAFAPPNRKFTGGFSLIFKNLNRIYVEGILKMDREQKAAQNQENQDDEKDENDAAAKDQKTKPKVEEKKGDE